jgi:hypothetical protein
MLVFTMIEAVYFIDLLIGCMSNWLTSQLDNQLYSKFRRHNVVILGDSPRGLYLRVILPLNIVTELLRNERRLDETA